MITRNRLYNIIFGTDTKAGREFDLVLLWIIFISAAVVMLDSLPDLDPESVQFLQNIEYVLTGIFTIEYIVRIAVCPKPSKYIFSFWGIIDVMSVLPTYLSLFFFGFHYLLIVRIFRLLRVFRILKLVRFNKEANILLVALKASSYKIGVFLVSVLAIATFMGTVMYVLEGGKEGYNSIPQSIYWAIVTITTVGYGDVVPQTILGKMVSSLAMIMGYAIIAVPTGIVTVELTQVKKSKRSCKACDEPVLDQAVFCHQCGERLEEG